MPAGLDGNPNPVVTQARSEVLAAVADAVLRVDQSRVLVGIDGQSGAGKSTFADELAARIRGRGVRTLRSTTDSFHRPREQRMRQGPTSAEGFFNDSHQLDAIVAELLRPFAEGAGQVRVAAFDEPSNTAVDEMSEIATTERTVLVFDGLFLQRPEFESFWNLSVFLDADERRDRDWLEFLLADLPEAPTAKAKALDERLERARWPRYRSGWRGYVETFGPTSRASMVIENSNIPQPRIVKSTATSS